MFEWIESTHGCLRWCMLVSCGYCMTHCDLMITIAVQNESAHFIDESVSLYIE